MTAAPPLSALEERTLRQLVDVARPTDPPVSTRTVRRLLASLDAARADAVRVRGTKVLSFPSPASRPRVEPTFQPDPAA